MRIFVVGMKGTMWHSRAVWVVGMMAAVALVCAVGCLLCGSVDIPVSEVWRSFVGGDVEKSSWRVIVLETRVPMVLTAAMAGAALSVSGLLLQTCFNNPLAGPSILGISSGASLGVAVVILAFGGMAVGGVGLYINVLLGAILGAGMVLAALMMMSKVVRSTAMLLIVGILAH